MNANRPLQPHEPCAEAKKCIAEALDGVKSVESLSGLRAQLAHCPPCVRALDLELHFRAAMAQRCRDQAPLGLQHRIVQAMERVDLTQIDVTDL